VGRARRGGRDERWIDTYHAVRSLSRQGTFVFVTDSAVGAREEDNIRHLVTNLGSDAPRDRVIPFLTSKHSLDYCLAYAERAEHHGFHSLVVLGGDKRWDRRGALSRVAAAQRSARQRSWCWAAGEPHADPARWVSADAEFNGEFFLTQVVAHDRALSSGSWPKAAARRLPAGDVRRVLLPREPESWPPGSAVPAEALAAELRRGRRYRTIRAIRRRRAAIYVSNSAHPHAATLDGSERPEHRALSAPPRPSFSRRQRHCASG
jgi:hypothetical protein